MRNLQQRTWLGISKLAFALLSLTMLLGCGNRAPEKPQLSPEESGAQAISEYDADSNGSISKKEAEAAPGLLAAFEKIDTDGDGEATAEEIANRIVYYQTSTSWVINGTCKVTYRGRPLEGANVVFEPESFLGSSFYPCSGETDERGEAFITREAAESVPGIYLGFYRVRITKEKKNGNELLPAKYNEETTLGFEANNDVPDDSMYGNVEFKLK